MRRSYHPYDQLIRYKHKNGSTIWIRSRGVVIRNAQGKALRMLGAHIDVSNEKYKEAELESQIKRFNSIISGTNMGTWEWNVETGETIFSERWASMIGYTLEDLKPTSFKTWARLLHPED